MIVNRDNVTRIFRSAKLGEIYHMRGITLDTARLFAREAGFGLKYVFGHKCEVIEKAKC